VRRKPYHGPRAASYAVILDGRPVTATGSLELAMRQAVEAAAAGRRAFVVRTEACAYPGCCGGVVTGRKSRGSMFPTLQGCPQCADEPAVTHVAFPLDG
jgi:hypothetical protein